MTFYLSNPDIQPTGWEAAEFIDAPLLPDPPMPPPATPEHDAATGDPQADTPATP